jgi:hypothetical protein
MVTTATPVFGQAIADMNAAIAPMLGNVVATVDGVDMLCMFSDPSVANSLGDSGIQANQPMLELATVDVPDGIRGKSVVVNGVNYTVAVHKRSGYGLSTLLLEAA